MATDDKIKALAESYPMKGGDGPLSYAKNSSFQGAVVDVTKKMITEAIAEKLDLSNPSFESATKLLIADLGCSVGPNTFVAVQNIIEAIEQKYKTNDKNPSTLEFQVFFNDHVSNDFNTLFRNLPFSGGRPAYFAAGVPGSFYGRLFPKSTLHIVHSSSSLNWLSRVPDEVVDKNSLAWNKGRIYCSGDDEKVAGAFAAQYEKDMGLFLKSRAEELVEGGLMVLLFGGIPNEVTFSQTPMATLYDVLGSCMFELANEGLISEEKANSFNLPLYNPSPKELENTIHKNGCFSIERMDSYGASSFQSKRNIQMSALQVRAGMEDLFKNHFGDEITEELFERFSRKQLQNIFTMDYKNVKGNMLIFLVLKRKSIGF